MENIIDGNSLDVKQVKIDELKQLFPEMLTEGKIDFERLKCFLADEINTKPDRYELSWAGKQAARREIQKQTTATLIPDGENLVRFLETSQGLKSTDCENIFIEGENLETLRVLQHSYFNKVKMIYIDPPYNTGNDSFVYPDDFSQRKSDYEKSTGKRDQNNDLNKLSLWEKNTKENGQYHSNWLSMMYPRLYMARNLLTNDGVIFVSIDDNEVHNLRLLMNEIFGEENFLACIIWEKKYAANNMAQNFSDIHEYIICFSKQKFKTSVNQLPSSDEQKNRYKNIDNDFRGDWKSGDFSVTGNSLTNNYPITLPSGRVVLPPEGRSWLFSKEKYEELINDNRIWFGFKNDSVPSYKRFWNETKQGLTPVTLLKHQNVGHTDGSNKHLKEIFNNKQIFDYPKPVNLIKHFLLLATNSNDNHLILDFFAGSGTTAQAVMELNKKDGGNRKFICVQMPETTDEKSEAFKAGYKTIADICKERIKRVVTKLRAETEKDILGLENEIFNLKNSLITTMLDEDKVLINDKIFETEEKILNLKKLLPSFGFNTYKLESTNFKIWQTETESNEEFEAQLNAFQEPVANYESQKTNPANLLTEIILKSGFELTVNIQKMEFDNCQYYNIANNYLYVCLQEVSSALFLEFCELKPQKIIVLSQMFTSQESEKILGNATLQLKVAEIEMIII